ncbi:MAG: hypothetical protein FJZ80_04660 [Bacteroidetes bacterium]|nr:hypothetical protein [Bacteroidota bacterium]MBM3424152.1 hypothetical protein [Bacteroidota bacterium]
MSELYIYLIILIFAVAILNSNLAFGANPLKKNLTENLSVIEQLTKYSSKQKNYRRTPKNFASFGYAVHARMVEEDAFLEYKFPFVGSKEAQFTLKLNAKTTSSTVSKYGCKTHCFARDSANTYKLQSTDHTFLYQNMNADGFYFYGFGKDEYGINYNEVIALSDEVNYAVAKFIEIELQKMGKDTYENRVRAALHFVQFIPYGVPDFDAGDDSYFGLALPHESLAISYSDCDSKSTMFAGILHHLISEQNIVLVGCVIEGQGHMITGVAGLYYPGQYVSHQGKDYLLIETTTPITLENQPSNRFQEISVISVKQQ